MNRAPGTTWMLRVFGVTPNGVVRTTDDDRILIAVWDGKAEERVITVSRRDARLLARRINQCLDGTAKQ